MTLNTVLETLNLKKLFHSEAAGFLPRGRFLLEGSPGFIDLKEDNRFRMVLSHQEQSGFVTWKTGEVEFRSRDDFRRVFHLRHHSNGFTLLNRNETGPVRLRFRRFKSSDSLRVGTFAHPGSLN